MDSRIFLTIFVLLYLNLNICQCFMTSKSNPIIVKKNDHSDLGLLLATLLLSSNKKPSTRHCCRGCHRDYRPVPYPVPVPESYFRRFKLNDDFYDYDNDYDDNNHYISFKNDNN